MALELWRQKLLEAHLSHALRARETSALGMSLRRMDTHC